MKKMKGEETQIAPGRIAAALRASAASVTHADTGAGE